MNKLFFVCIMMKFIVIESDLKQLTFLSTLSHILLIIVNVIKWFYAACIESKN